jgi:hypothetical protein
MKISRAVVVGVVALLLGAIVAPPAWSVVACGATGEAQATGDGTFTYRVTVTWGFEGQAVPERIDLALTELVDCEFYNPEDPIQALYVQPGTGTSAAAPGCLDVQGAPRETIDWVGEVRYEDPDCWLPTLHIAYENTGATESCLPLSDDTGVFTFTSHGLPLPVYTYYDALLIRAGDLCIVCDYTGPLPDCNMWSDVDRTSWGTIKSLYR